MTTLYPQIGLDSPAYSYQVADYTSLLTDPFADNQLWDDFATSLNTLYDGVVHFAQDQLYQVRTPAIDPVLTAYNTRMLGFEIPLYSFTNDQYVNLLQSLGTYYQTTGASNQFLNFLGYIEGTQFSFIPLYANSLTQTTPELTDSPGSFIWNGGTYFATPYYDIQYSEADYPNLNVQQFVQILYKIAPIYLVLRSIAFLTNTTTAIYISPFCYDKQRDRTLASYP